MRGKLITLEGIDGSGKSTVAEKLQKNPEIKAFKPVFTREPTRGTLTGNVVEKAIQSDTDQLAELFLFTADHAEHLAKLIKPALEKGKIVISDRYSDSRYAYQGMTLKTHLENPLEWVKDLHRGWTIVPDLTFLFDIRPEISIERCGKRGEQSKFEKLEFLRGVREIFLKLAANDPERFIVIDASHSPKYIEKEVVKKIMEFLSRN
ncbi:MULTISPECIES: dTMP kinase [Methanosarcina]|uniref:Probable thymidylate kinase n=3 Tax=Methanosarcina barkeri TaxID=2208 RepID=A0A0E3LPD9_METBA|nr:MULTISPECIES: dTMP kinase [Methanosarcina]AKB56351.1 Thymidylate kinase [Methanosarcina barkeri MS]AKB59822.1 Thymidylate kinase [Methanosarcina barkeri 227]AKJ40473.1 thymidylate kinase Tmk [Methanosarcina barkeri CM1]OEC90283.1 dTMP kinase [Methanosarcina sp. A14]